MVYMVNMYMYILASTRLTQKTYVIICCARLRNWGCRASEQVKILEHVRKRPQLPPPLDMSKIVISQDISSPRFSGEEQYRNGKST